jgi:hypothetical protein
MSSICKHCNVTELVFDSQHKTKSGKFIPLEKSTGLPHNCPENPFKATNGDSTYLQQPTISDVMLQIKFLQQKQEEILYFLKERTK